MTSVAREPGFDDRRENYRCAVVGDRSAAVLRLGTRQVRAEVIDESADGFAIVVDEGIRASQGDLFSLGTVEGWVEVEVRNVQFQQWAQTDESGAIEVRTRTRLGLKRLRDLTEWNDEDARHNRLSLAAIRRLLSMLRPFGKSFTKAAVIVGGMLAIAAGMIWGLEGKVKREVPVVKVLTEPKAVEEPKYRIVRVPRQELPEFLLPAKADVPRLPPLVFPSELLHLLSGPEVLFEPQIVSRLALSPQQLAELEKIYKAAEAVGTEATDTDAADRKLALARRGLGVLTELQQRSLVSILRDIHRQQQKTSSSEDGSEAAPVTTETN